MAMPGTWSRYLEISRYHGVSLREAMRVVDDKPTGMDGATDVCDLTPGHHALQVLHRSLGLTVSVLALL